MAIIITREELYAQVWAEPIKTVSKGFGISDVALAKHCERNGFRSPLGDLQARSIADNLDPVINGSLGFPRRSAHDRRSEE